MEPVIAQLISSHEQNEAGMREWWYAMADDDLINLFELVEKLVHSEDAAEYTLGKLANYALSHALINWRRPGEEDAHNS
jgi:hypothetical protein